MQPDNNTLEDNYQNVTAINNNNNSGMGKNKLILIIGFIFLIIALILLSLFYPKDKGKTVDNIKLSDVLIRPNVSQVLASTKSVSSDDNKILSDYQGDYFLTNNKTLMIRKSDGGETEIAKNIGANTGFKLDLDKKRLFYRSGMDGTVVDLATGEKKTLHGLMNAYFTDNYTLFSVMKDDGKTYLYNGDSPTPIFEGSCLVVSTLTEDKIAVLDVDVELNYPMPGYIQYDDKQQATNLKLVKIDLANLHKQYAPITLANSDRGSVNINNKIVYQDNNNQTKINNGESEIEVKSPINIQTLSAINGTNSALYADVSREKQLISINRIDLTNGDIDLMGKYSFKDSIYSVPSDVPVELQNKLSTPASKVIYDEASNSFQLSVGDNYLSMPANTNPRDGVAIKTNNFNQLANMVLDRKNSSLFPDKLSPQNEIKSQVLSEQDARIPNECILMVQAINKDTSEQDARNSLDQALRCFGAYSDETVQSLDIRNLITLDSENKILNLASSPDIIDKLIILVRNGKSFQIKKTASQFINKTLLPIQSAQALQFVPEKTNFTLSDLYNDNIKVRNFFDSRQRFNLIDYARNVSIDHVANNSLVALAETAGPFPCDAPSGQCVSHDGSVTDAADPTIVDTGTGWCRAGEVLVPGIIFSCTETIPSNPTLNNTPWPSGNNNPTAPTNNNPLTPNASSTTPTSPTINPSTPSNNPSDGAAV